MTAGLHDDDRPPPAAVQDEVHAKWREWGFWGVMTIGLWAAFQGMAIIALWFTLVLLIVLTVRIVVGPVADEISKTWRT